MTSSYYELVPGQPAYIIGGVGQLVVNGHMMDYVRRDTVLPIGPNNVPGVAVVNRMWEMENELSGRLQQGLISRQLLPLSNFFSKHIIYEKKSKFLT